jgi:CP family cyanate transporter-like MFS transporter
MGVFITVGNVVVPVLIRRDFDPARVGFATDLYTSALRIGSMITSVATAPWLVGAAYDASGGWTRPLLVIAAAVVLLATSGIAATVRFRRRERS